MKTTSANQSYGYAPPGKYPLAGLLFLLVSAQIAIGQISVYSAPSLAPGERYAIPLSLYGYKKAHYSVLVKVRLQGDAIYYTVPGQLPRGHSLSFVHKAGKKEQGDTLFIICRRGGRPVELAEILVQAFHRSDCLLSDRLIFGKPDRGFTKAVVGGYYDDQTLRGTMVRGRARKGDGTPVLMDSAPQLPEPANELSFWRNKRKQ